MQIESPSTSRRTIVKSAAFGMLAVALPCVARSGQSAEENVANSSRLHAGYPAIGPDVVSEVVGVSHFDLRRLKELVDPRPELAKATWDWGFGDWESAIGAASHVGRRDIIEYLISKGAQPTLFTFAVLGQSEVVQAMLRLSPQMQQLRGPHGISLMRHAQIGLQSDGADQNNSQALIDYLTKLELPEETYLDMSDEEKQKYIGDYKYGPAQQDALTIQLNMRKLLSLGRIGEFGGALYKTAEKQFTYNGAPSDNITFQHNGDNIESLTITGPGWTLTARKSN